MARNVGNIIAAVTSALNSRSSRLFLLPILVLLLAGILLRLDAGRSGDRLVDTWRRREAAAMRSTVESIGKRIKQLEVFSSRTARQAGAILADEAGTCSLDSIPARTRIFDRLEKLAASAREGGLPAGSELGIQVFDADGRRLAWSGWPHELSEIDRQLIVSGRDLIYTRQVSLYRILTRVVPVKDKDGSRVAEVVVEIPLEANYKVNNRFIKGSSLADEMRSPEAATIQFRYFPSVAEMSGGADAPGGSSGRRGRPEKKPAVALSAGGLPPYMEWTRTISGDERSGLSAEAVVKSEGGKPLLRMEVKSFPFEHFASKRRNARLLAAKSCVVAAFVLLFFLAFTRIPRRGFRAMMARVVSLVVFMVALRYSLLAVHISQPGGGFKVFDPVIFATPILHGIMRSAGDLLITSLFLILLVYGILKIAREAEIGRPERRPGGAWRTIPTVLVSLFLLLALFAVTSRFIGAVVVNANPRLIGASVNFFAPEVIVLHLGVFFMLVGMFLGVILMVWGLLRLSGDTVVLRVVLGLSFMACSIVFWGWIIGVFALLVLLFILFAPRFIHREDLVSIVLASFYFVVIVSGSAYVHFNEEYQGLRKIFIEEKAGELANPSDNWKAFIIEDILDNLSGNAEVRRALREDGGELARTSFNLWAESPLSLLGYSSAIYVLNSEDSLVSRFSIDMPFRANFTNGKERIDTPAGKKTIVHDLVKNTSRGMVRFYRGIVNIEDFVVDETEKVEHVALGKVIIDVPYFFENLFWAARTGPRTPEILRNIQEGGVEPRLEEPEDLLLARLRGSFVEESSSDDLPVGYRVDEERIEKALSHKWPLLSLENSAYRFVVKPTEEKGMKLLAGFKVPSPVGHGLRWSMLLSLYMLFTLVVILSIILLKRVPMLQGFLPTLTPGRRLEFQQKLLASFLVVALVPAIILGAFSTRVIKRRFVAESKKEALSKALNAEKVMASGLKAESKIAAGDLDVAMMADSLGYGVAEFRGNRILALLRDTGEPISEESVFLLAREECTYAGVFSRPFTLAVQGAPVDFRLYYGRRLDSDLLGDIADQVGADVNVYLNGKLVAASREGLLASGLISPLMDEGAFVKVSLLGVRHMLATEKAGRYNYQVAYLPLEAWGGVEKAALSLPLLFRPESFRLEVQKATSIVFGIFALLFAATIGLGLLLARGIFRPLKELIEGTRRIARGDLSFRLPLKKLDEIGTVMSAFNDMTEQLARSQTALEQRRRYLEAILANIGTGVISTDAQDRIMTLNGAAENILGIAARDATGMTPLEVAERGIMRKFFSVLAEGIASGEPFLSSEMDIEKGSERRTIKYMLTRLTYDDRYLGSVFVFEDLTELIDSKKLSAWVEMARQIAHEIKNPLTPIRLSTQFMVKAYSEKAPDFEEIFKESSDTIIQQVDVLKRIAGEFSSFGKMQKLELEPRKVVPLLETVIKPYMHNASGVDLSLDVGGLGDVQVLVEPEAFRKICTNLVENALEAMPGGGSLRIAGEVKTVDGSRVVRIIFQDTGPGLSDEVKGKLFEPYFSTKTTGTGLGLAICRTLSREMGGDVTVENLPGGGAVAALELKEYEG
jgi:PAS domain S-box-containing protein